MVSRQLICFAMISHGSPIRFQVYRLSCWSIFDRQRRYLKEIYENLYLLAAQFLCSWRNMTIVIYRYPLGWWWTSSIFVPANSNDVLSLDTSVGIESVQTCASFLHHLHNSDKRRYAINVTSLWLFHCVISSILVLYIICFHTRNKTLIHLH